MRKRTNRPESLVWPKGMVGGVVVFNVAAKCPGVLFGSTHPWLEPCRDLDIINIATSDQPRVMPHVNADDHI